MMVLPITPSIIHLGLGLSTQSADLSSLLQPSKNTRNKQLTTCAGNALDAPDRKSTPQKPLLIDAGRVPPTINED